MNDTKPFREYEIGPQVDTLYRAMVERNRKDRQKIHSEAQRKLARQKAEEGIRESWTNLTNKERHARIASLEDLCNDLINHHPDYESFKTAKVSVIDGVCKIHWNGARFDESTNWGMIDREFPVSDINIVHKRYADRLRLQEKEEEI